MVMDVCYCRLSGYRQVLGVEGLWGETMRLSNELSADSVILILISQSRQMQTDFSTPFCGTVPSAGHYTCVFVSSGDFLSQRVALSVTLWGYLL